MPGTQKSKQKPYKANSTFHMMKRTINQEAVFATHENLQVQII